MLIGVHTLFGQGFPVREKIRAEIHEEAPTNLTIPYKTGVKYFFHFIFGTYISDFAENYLFLPFSYNPGPK